MENQRHQLELLPNFWKRTKSLEHPHKSRNTWITWGNLWMPMPEQCLVQGCELLFEIFEKLTLHPDWHSMEASQLTESSVLLSCFFNKSSKDGNKSQVNLTDSTVINHHSCWAILHIKTKRFLFCQYRTSPYLKVYLSNPLIIVLPGVKPGENMNLQYLTSNLAITHPWRECSIIVSRHQNLQNLKNNFSKNFSV